MRYENNGYKFDDFYTTILHIRWSKFIKKLSSFSIKKIYKEALKNKYNAYFYCLNFKYGFRKIHKYIIDESDPKFAFLFYRDIENANKNKMKKIFLNSTKYLVKFALEVDNSFIRKAENNVLKTRDAFCALKLLSGKKFINEKKLVDIVLKEGKPRQLISLSRLYYSNKILINKIKDRLMKLKDFKHLTYLVMNNFYYFDISKIENFFKTSGTVSDVLFFANKVKRSKLHELLIFT